MQPGDKVGLIANPGRKGIIGNETEGPLDGSGRPVWRDNFVDKDQM